MNDNLEIGPVSNLKGHPAQGKLIEEERGIDKGDKVISNECPSFEKSAAGDGTKGGPGALTGSVAGPKDSKVFG